MAIFQVSEGIEYLQAEAGSEEGLAFLLFPNHMLGSSGRLG